LVFRSSSYRTTLCLQYHPQQVALGAIFLATLHLALSPVSASKRQTVERSWFELLQSQEGDLPSLDNGIDEQSLLGLYIFLKFGSLAQCSDLALLQISAVSF
jgi:hypothetical protein